MSLDKTSRAESKKYSSNIKGRLSELRAETKLLELGYIVTNPTLHNEPFDLVIKDPDDESGKYYQVQVKTVRLVHSERHNGTWAVVDGNSNGRVYSLDEVQKFVAVDGEDVYMFDNREINEYWVRPDEMSEKWTKL